MAVCVLCESENFDSIDGLYFCQSCGTQSQDIRDEDVDEAYEVQNTRLQVSKKGKVGQKKTIFTDKGKPWFMYEAYQHIMKAQVEFLIGVGVNPALKDVVFKLWYKYLQVTGSAFTGTPDGALPSKSSLFYCRDAELLGKNQRKKRQKRIDSAEEDELELCSHFSDEEYYEGDDTSQALPKASNDADDIKLGEDWTALSSSNIKVADDVKSSDDSSESSGDEFVGSISVKDYNDKKKSTDSRTRVRTGHMSLKLTLAFCYLGLLWINEPVFMSDLIRWAKQGQFPFFQATRHLPAHMKFGFGDFQCLCPNSVPLVRAILKSVSQMARLMRLPRFPDQNWSTYTSRFITDLHLPGFLHGIVRNLMEKVKIKGKIHPAIFNGGGRCIPNFETGAMAFIVVAMKLCYGIDGRTEREQETVAEPMESSRNRKSSDKIPLFTDWLKSRKCCEAKKLENDVPWSDEQLKLVHNPTTYTSFCKSDIFGSWEPCDKVYTGIAVKHFRASRTTNEESQQRYAQLFRSLMSKDQEKEFNGVVTPQVTSFPATCSHVADDEVSCFDNLRSRGINTERLFEYGEAVKYIYYMANDQNQNSFHSSYDTLLDILADRIEVKVEDIQDKVAKLEKALFFKESLRYGFL